MSVDTIGQIASYVSPAVVIIGGARWLVGIITKRWDQARADDRKAAEERVDAVQKSIDVYQETTIRTLSRIEAQTTKTNGRVDALEIAHAKITGILEERKRHE